MSHQTYLFGRHTIESLLQHEPKSIVTLYVQEGLRDYKDIAQKAVKHNIRVVKVSRDELSQITASEQHQGLAAMIKKRNNYDEKALKAILDQHAENVFLLILDGVQDPHNLGACFRTADAAGVHAIIAPKDKAVGLTPTVSKVASGAAEVVPFIQVTNLARTMAALKAQGIWLFGADASGTTTIYDADLKGPVGIVMGAEGTGLRRLTREHCDHLLSIPMHGTVASLNVSVATGVLLFEALRQRLNG